MDFIIKILRTSTFEEYELKLPQNDLEEYFLIHGWLYEFKSKDYLCIELIGDTEFDYEETIDISILNNLLLKLRKLPLDEQEKVKTIFLANNNTLDALQYAIENADKYTLIPKSVSKKQRTRFLFHSVYGINNYEVFEDVLSSDDYIAGLMRKGYAYKIDGKILVKSIDLLGKR